MMHYYTTYYKMSQIICVATKMNSHLACHFKRGLSMILNVNLIQIDYNIIAIGPPNFFSSENSLFMQLSLILKGIVPLIGIGP